MRKEAKVGGRDNITVKTEIQENTGNMFLEKFRNNREERYRAVVIWR